MAKFMFVYRSENKDVDISPEQMQQAMQVWGQWMEAGGKAGWLVDGGDALKPTGKMVAADKTVTDGPFIESKELVGGFSIVEAMDLAAAVELAKDCPMITVHQGSVEVREFAGMGQE